MKSEDVKEIRKRLGMTQEALARELGVACQTVNKWERGANQPSCLAIDRIKRVIEEREIKYSFSSDKETLETV